MPFISIQTAAPLPQEKRAAIARELADLIAVIPGKSVANLMLAFHGDTPMVIGGKEAPDILFMELRLRGEATQEAKKTVTEESFRIFAKVLGVPPENVYITIQEFANWGARGSYL